MLSSKMLFMNNVRRTVQEVKEERLQMRRKARGGERQKPAREWRFK